MTLLQKLAEVLRAPVAGAAPAVAGLEHQRGQGTGFVIAARSERLPPTFVATGGQARGVRIVEVGENTPAAAAKLQNDDLLLALDDKAVESIDDLQRFLVLSSNLALTLWRAGARYELWIEPAWPKAA